MRCRAQRDRLWHIGDNARVVRHMRGANTGEVGKRSLYSIMVRSPRADTLLDILGEC